MHVRHGRGLVVGLYTALTAAAAAGTRQDISSAMAEGLRDALVNRPIEKSLQLMNDIDIHPTVAAIKRPYGISLPVCGLLFQRLYTFF